MSQFWYDIPTSETLTKEVLTNATNALSKGLLDVYNIACISCPTLFKCLHSYLKEFKNHSSIPDLALYCDRINIKLLEYDRRFGLYGDDYIFYDYNNPLSIDTQYHNKFDLIISDPPYLSDECHVKTGMTIKKLGKNEHKLLICTGKSSNKNTTSI